MYKTGMQRVYHSTVEDIDELRERVISVWCELDQSVVNHVWNPGGCLSTREWELSLPLLCVAADDEWAVPQGLSMFRRLPTVPYHHTHQSLASVRPVWPIVVMGQEEWPTQPELRPPLYVAA